MACDLLVFLLLLLLVLGPVTLSSLPSSSSSPSNDVVCCFCACSSVKYGPQLTWAWEEVGEKEIFLSLRLEQPLLVGEGRHKQQKKRSIINNKVGNFLHREH